jgi:hypothetical protein
MNNYLFILPYLATFKQKQKYKNTYPISLYLYAKTNIQSLL